MRIRRCSFNLDQLEVALLEHLIGWVQQIVLHVTHPLDDNPEYLRGRDLQELLLFKVKLRDGLRDFPADLVVDRVEISLLGDSKYLLLQEFLEYGEVGIQFIDEKIEELFQGLHNFLVVFAAEVDARLAQDIVFRLLHHVECLKLVHQLSRHEVLPSSRVLHLHIPDHGNLQIVECLQHR